MVRILRLGFALPLLGLFTLTPQATVTRAQSLNPPPPPFVTCRDTGSGTSCMGSTDISGSFVIPGENNPCGFDITFSQQGIGDVTLQYDRNGNLVTELDRTPGSTFSISANGQTLSSATPALYHIDYVNNTFKITGMQFVFQIPGQKPIVTAGEVVVDLNTGQVTQHGTFTGLFSPAVCAYLSGS